MWEWAYFSKPMHQYYWLPVGIWLQLRMLVVNYKALHGTRLGYWRNYLALIIFACPTKSVRLGALQFLLHSALWWDRGSISSEIWMVYLWWPIKINMGVKYKFGVRSKSSLHKYVFPGRKKMSAMFHVSLQIFFLNCYIKDSHPVVGGCSSANLVFSWGASCFGLDHWVSNLAAAYAKYGYYANKLYIMWIWPVCLVYDSVLYLYYILCLQLSVDSWQPNLVLRSLFIGVVSCIPEMVV